MRPCKVQSGTQFLCMQYSIFFIDKTLHILSTVKTVNDVCTTKSSTRVILFSKRAGAFQVQQKRAGGFSPHTICIHYTDLMSHWRQSKIRTTKRIYLNCASTVHFLVEMKGACMNGLGQRVSERSIGYVVFVPPISGGGRFVYVERLLSILRIFIYLFSPYILHQ